MDRGLFIKLPFLEFDAVAGLLAWESFEKIGNSFLFCRSPSALSLRISIVVVGVPVESPDRDRWEDVCGDDLGWTHLVFSFLTHRTVLPRTRRSGSRSSGRQMELNSLLLIELIHAR